MRIRARTFRIQIYQSELNFREKKSLLELIRQIFDFKSKMQFSTQKLYFNVDFFQKNFEP